MVDFNIIEQIIIGGILGDGSISPEGNYQETHCEKQKDYLFWKGKILETEFRIKISYYITKKKEDNPKYWTKQNQYRLRTQWSPFLREYRQLCYPNGKKIVSDEFIKRIGKLAIVVWYFDDGSYGVYKNGIQIHSLCFTLEENQKLQRMLKNKFGLNFRVGCSHPNRTKFPYYLFCHGKETDNFLKFIKENALYIPKSMTYKMGKFHKGNLKWIEEKRKSLKNQRDSYCQNNKKLIKKSNHRYYEENKNKIKIKLHEYYQNNKDKFIGYAEKRRREHPEKLKEMFHKHYIKNKERILIESHKRYIKNKGKMQKIKSERLKNGFCIYCGKKNNSKDSQYSCVECRNKRNIKDRTKRMEQKIKRIREESLF